MLRGFVRQFLLTEELVSMQRGDKTKMYDATFDESGNLVRAVPFNTKPDEEAQIEAAAAVTKASLPQIYKAVVAAGPQREAVSASRVAAVLARLASSSPDFAAALSWGGKNPYGAGEAALRIAFKFKPTSSSEPDFVSEDGEVALSVKHFGDGSRTVRNRSGGGSGDGITQLINDFVSEMEPVVTKKDISVSTFTPKMLEEKLNAVTDMIKLKDCIEACEKFVAAAKTALTVEHGAQGIIAIDDKGLLLITPDSAKSNLKVYAIRDGGVRMEFYGPNAPEGRKTYEQVITNAKRRLTGDGASSREETPAGLGGV